MAKKRLLCKYWRGWLNHTDMVERPELWIELWSNVAKKADEDGFELLLFKVPKENGNTSSIINEIEALLQERFDK